MKVNKLSLLLSAGAISAFIGSFWGYFLYKFIERNLGTLIGTSFWTCCIGLCLVASFLLVQDYYVGKVTKFDFSYLVSVLSGGLNKLVIGAIGGLIGGASLVLVGGGWFGWGVEGVILGGVLGITIPNISRIWTCIGGGIAGAFGFILIQVFASYQLNEAINIALGDSVKGILFGVMIFISEKISRKAWVEIIYPGNEIRTVSLGKEPILFGGGDIKPKVGQLIYVPGTTSIKKKYTFETGQVKCFCDKLGKEAILPDGHRESVGRIKIVTHIK